MKVKKKIDLFQTYWIAKREWNEFADGYNQWSELDEDEKIKAIYQILILNDKLNSIEANNLLTDISEETWLEWEAFSDTSGEIPKTRKELLESLEYCSNPIKHIGCKPNPRFITNTAITLRDLLKKTEDLSLDTPIFIYYGDICVMEDKAMDILVAKNKIIIGSSFLNQHRGEYGISRGVNK